MQFDIKDAQNIKLHKIYCAKFHFCCKWDNASSEAITHLVQLCQNTTLGNLNQKIRFIMESFLIILNVCCHISYLIAI